LIALFESQPCSLRINNLMFNPKIYSAMLKYVKEVLSKVSFDKELFEKELKKALKMLMPFEVRELKAWCYKKFGNLYRAILDKCFVQVSV